MQCRGMQGDVIDLGDGTTYQVVGGDLVMKRRQPERRSSPARLQRQLSALLQGPSLSRGPRYSNRTRPSTATELSHDDDILNTVLVDNVLGLRTHKMASSPPWMPVDSDEVLHNRCYFHNWWLRSHSRLVLGRGRGVSTGGSLHSLEL